MLVTVHVIADNVQDGQNNIFGQCHDAPYCYYSFYCFVVHITKLSIFFLNKYIKNQITVTSMKNPYNITYLVH